MRTINISAKCSDMFSATLRDNDKTVGEYNGYVPYWMGIDGDYIEMKIDIDTGRIIGWIQPTRAALKIFTPIQ